MYGWPEHPPNGGPIHFLNLRVATASFFIPERGFALKRFVFAFARALGYLVGVLRGLAKAIFRSKLKRIRVIFMAVVAGLLAMTVSIAASAPASAGSLLYGTRSAVTTPVVDGYGGGLQGVVECPSGQFLQAIRTVHGTDLYITYMRFWCKSLTASTATLTAVGENDRYVLGGNESNSATVSCDGNSYASGIRLVLSPYVDDIGLECRNIVTGATSNAEPVHGQGSVTHTASCPTGQFLAGFRAWTGGGVDRIENIICQSLQYQLSTPSISAVTDNGATLSVALTNVDSMANAQYQVNVYDSTSNALIATAGPVAYGSGITVSDPDLYCGRGYKVEARASGISGGVGVFDKASPYSAQTTVTASSGCWPSALTINTSATSNLRFDSTNGLYQAITKNSAANLNVSDLRTLIQTGASGTYPWISASSVTWAANAPLTLSAGACGGFNLGAAGAVSIASAVDASACTNTPTFVIGGGSSTLSAEFKTKGPFSVNSTGAVSVTGQVITTGSSGTQTFAGTSISLTGGLSSSKTVSATSSSASADVTLGGGVTIADSGQKLFLKSKRAVIFSSSQTIETNNGDIVGWADSDSTNGGYIKVDASVTIKSKGGKIWLAGGADDGGTAATITAAKGAWSSLATSNNLPDGYAQGDATQADGVLLNTDHLLYSAGGDIFIAGMNTSLAHNGSTIITKYGTVDSGTGRIAMWGKASATGYYTYGLNLHYYGNSAIPQVITSSNQTAQAISLYCDSGPSTHAGSDGFWSPWYSVWRPQDTGHQGLRVLATGLSDASNPGGTINITGIGSNTNGQDGGHGVRLDFVDLLAKSGSINVTGYESDGAGDGSSASIVLGGSGDSAYSEEQPQNLVRFGAWTDYAAATAGNLYTNQAGVQTNFATSESDINLLGDKMVFMEDRFGTSAPAQGYKFTTSGDITIAPVGQSFTVNQEGRNWYFARTSIGGNPSSFTLGKDGNTANVTWWHDVNAAGPIKIYGGDLHLNNTTAGDLSTTMNKANSGANKPGILLKSAGKLYLNNNIDLTTSGADITLWSDFDDNGSGSIWLDDTNKVRSNGGKITLAGGLDDGANANPEITDRAGGDGYPDNYATGIAGWGADSGINLHPNYVLASSGGGIFLAGKSSSAASTAKNGILFYYGLTNSGAGNIAMYGKVPAANTNWHRGIQLSGSDDNGLANSIISASTSASAIKIYGEATATAGNLTASFGIQSFYNNRTNILATAAGGGIEIVGKNSDGTHNNGGGQFSAPVELNYTKVLAKSGPITISGISSVAENESVMIGGRGAGQGNIIGGSSSAIATGFDNLSVTVGASTSPISIVGTGKRVYIDAALSTNYANETQNGVLVKSTGDLELAPSVAVATAGSRATFWARSAALNSSSTAGAIKFGNSVSVLTNGGTLTLAGSSSTDSATSLPNGYAYTDTGSSGGVQLGTSELTTDTNVLLNSGGGKLDLRGKQVGASNASWGVIVRGGSTINSGTGTISVDAASDSNSGNGLDLETGSNTQIKFLSAATSGTAISLTGASTSNVAANGGQRGIYAGAAGLIINASGGGSIALNGTSAVTNTTGPGAIRLAGADILSTTGNVTLNGGTKGFYLTGTYNLGALSGATASSGAVSLIGEQLNGGPTINVKTTGAVVAESSGASFSAAFSSSNLNISGPPTSLRIGQTGNTSAINIDGGALSVAGPVGIYGSSVTAAANIQTTSGGILLKSSGNVAISGARTISTQGGDITLWSDHDALGGGRITVDSSSSLTSNGGKITLAGGLDTGASTVKTGRAGSDGYPDGYATGYSGAIIGVNLGTLVSIQSGNGDIFIAGRSAPATSTEGAMGIVIESGATINGGSGKIHIFGYSDAISGGRYSEAIRIKGVASSDQTKFVNITNSNADTDAIVIVGDASQAAGERSGGILVASWYDRTGGGPKNLVANSSSGGVTITGRGGTATGDTADSVGSGLEFGSIAILSKSGTITLNGTTASSNSSGGYGFTANHANVGKFVGAITFGALADTTINSVNMATSSANIRFNVDSLLVPNNGTSSTTVNTSGTVTIAPANDAQSFDRTFDISKMSIASTATGLTVGQAGTSSAAQSATDITATAQSIAGPISYYGGAINLSGTQSATGSGNAFLAKATGLLTVGANITTNSGNINLVADQMAVNANATTQSASAGTVTLTPLTATKPIGLGSVDSASLLGLTDAELDRITAGTLRIGDGTNSGNITVNAAISIDPLKVGATAIRTTGTVSGTGTIAATNLGISASSINLGTTSAVGGNLALAAGAAPTLSSSLAYTPASVDGILADFGTPTQITLAQVPTNQPQDAFMAVAFNPPPIATLKDKFNTALQTQNSLSTSSITAAKASGSGTLAGTLVRPATAGAATFSDLKVNTATGDHTITFSALSGTLTATTGTYAVQAGEPSSLVVSMGQTSVAAGKTFNAGTRPTVTLKDTSGNIIAAGPNATATVTAVFTGTNGAIVAGSTKAAVAGVATFDTLALSGKVENSYTIKYTVSFNPVANPSTTTTVESSSTAVTITPGEATQIALTQANGAANRITFVGQPSVAIKDAYGNTVTSSTASVTVSESSTAIALGGTVTKQAQSGVVTFDDLSLTGPAADGYTLTYTATSPAVSTTQLIDLTHGTATQLVKTSSASSVRAGQDIADTVIEIRDADNNLVDTGNGSTATLAATVTRDAGGTAATLVDGGVVAPQVALTRTASAGIATFNGLRLEGMQGAHTLNFKINSPSVLNAIETNQAMTLNPGVAANLRMVEEPTNIVANVAISPAVKVEFVDAWNNRVTQDANSATPILVDSSDSSVAISGQTKTAVSASSGLVTCTGLTFTKTGNFKLKFTSGALPALVSANSFSVTHGEAHHLAWVSAQPTAARSGIALTTQPQFEVQDQWNNPVASGTATTVTATVTSANVADVLSMASASATTGTGSAQVNFSNLAITAKAATYTVRYTATNANKAIDATYLETASVALTHGLAHHITAAPTTIAARSGIAFTTQPIVTVRDSAENVVEDSTLTVTASLPTGGSLTDQTLGGSITRTAANGRADFSANASKLSIAGSSATGLTLRFTVSTLLAQTLTTDVSVNLTPGAAIALQTKVGPSTVKRLENMTAPQVELIDAAGNVVAGDSASEVAYTVYKVSDNTVARVESAAIQASNGVVTLSSLNLTLAPSSYYLKYRLTSNNALLTSSNFVLNPGAVAKVVIVTQPSAIDGLLERAMTGELLKGQPVAQLLDADDYPVTTQNSGQVAISIASGAGGTLNGSTAATVSNGEATFSGVKLIGRPASSTQTAENYTLKFSFSGIDSVDSSALYVTHNVAHHLTATRAPGVGRAGIQLTGSDRPQVEIRDRYENVVISGAQSTADIQVSAQVLTGTGTATLGGVTVQSASSGIATFDVSLGGLTTNTYQLTYNFIDGGVTATSQSGVTISDGLASELRFATAPSTLDVSGARNKTGQALAVQPVIGLHDNWGNATEAASGIIDVAIAGAQFDPRDRLLNSSLNLTQGVATFTNLALIGRPGHDYALTFTWRNRGITLNSGANQNDYLRVTHADADHLTITQQPDSRASIASVRNRTGDALTVQPVVEVRDFDDNVVTSLSGGSFISASATTGGGSTTSTDDGTTNVNTAEIVNGIATFSALKLVATPDVDQKLTFTAPTILLNNSALTSAESTAFSVTYAAASQLDMQQQPCTGAVTNGTCAVGPTAGVLGTQPIVRVLDRFGNLVPNFVGSVTASVVGSDVFLTNTSDQTGRPLTATVANGLATFSGLELRGTPGTAYQINFATSGLTGVSSSNLVVTHGAATQIVMVRDAIGGQTGSALTTQPQVRLADIFGNTVTGDGSTVVTATVSGGSLFKTPTAVLEAQVVNGVATFAGLKFTGTPLTNYTLTFNSGQLSTATSGAFQVTHANISQLIWDVQPAVGQSGENLTTQPKLILKDFDNNVVTSDNSTVVTAAISTGTNGSLINATATASAGVVQFANLKLIGDPGATYKLTFTAAAAGGSSYAATESVALVPAHARPDAITMRTPSVISGGLTGTTLTNQPTLYVRDRFGNIATSDNSTVVTASIGSGVGGTVSGTVSATAVNGAVDFNGLVVRGTAGVSYQLSFSATTADNRTFTVLDSTSFTLDKVATASLSYVNQAYVPVGVTGNLVSPTSGVHTDSTATPVFATQTADTICVVDSASGVIGIRGVGTCVVTMTVPAATFYRTNSATANLVISKAYQSEVEITSADNLDFWSTNYTPTATQIGDPNVAAGYVFASTSNGFVYSVDGDCKFIGGKVIPGNAGSSCTLFAFKRGDANYRNSEPAELELTTNKIAQQTLRIGNSSSASVGDVELFTSGGSGEGSINYIVDDAGLAQCSLISGTNGETLLRASANGSCDIFAQKAASTNFNIATSTIRTFNFTKQDQVVSFTSTIPMNPVALGNYVPAASASSSLPVAISVTTGNGTTCQFDAVVPTKLNFLSSGVCVLTATQAGNGQFVASSTTQRITVGALNQTITFAEISNKKYGDTDFRLGATSNSGLAVIYQLGTNVSPQACSVSSTGLVSLASAGSCEIVATQPGNQSYLAAPPVTRLFEVAPDQAGKPRVVSISAGNQWFNASFVAPSYLGGTSIQSYRLQITDTATGDRYANSACSATPVLAGANLSCSVVGIPNGVSYTAQVAAITRAGLGLYSSVVGPLTAGAQIQGVTNLTTTRSGSNLLVNFEAPIATDSGVTGYRVSVAPAGTTNFGTPVVTQTLSASVSVSSGAGSGSTVQPQAVVNRGANVRFGMASLSVPTPSPSASATQSTGYEVKVETITSDPTAIDPNAYLTKGVYLGITAPDAVRSPLTTLVDGSAAGSKAIFLAWATPVADGGSPITGYNITVNGANLCMATTTLACEQPTAVPGQTYVFSITALNDMGASAPITVTHIVPAPPAVGGGSAPVVTPTPTETPTPTATPTATPRPTTSPRPTGKPTTSPSKPKPSIGSNSDTDGDSIVNNEDSDIDGDGNANGTDADMDGDGVENVADGDPTSTTGKDGDTPPKQPLVVDSVDTWWLRLVAAMAGVGAIAFAVRRWRRRSN